ncbi:hypothetical protein [Parendozoicomonas sp. Alg238-R29]|uniref:hypothetical protein n=1 Tax=Parendozoicomonas sp. Alg238-R29 TaxID=2993446 RepID=UPI00248D8477|nr:hypothetical protein [Parendozoicomonas sp. Alg238-R29]
MKKLGFTGFLAAGITLGLFCAPLVSAGDSDSYKATISLVDHTGMPLTVPGCSAIKKDSNRCIVFDSPTTVEPGDTAKIGEVTNSAHSAEGDFTIQAGSISDLYKLTYKFDKHFSESTIEITGGSSDVLLAVDPSTCTRSPDAEGALKCCSYGKDHKHKLYWEYTYDCELPVSAAN